MGARGERIPASDAIVPRWEWRTFGESFEDAERRLHSAPPGQTEESDEVYLLSVESDASVKIRNGLLDVKHLEHVNGDGLELWRPVMKATSPLSAADVGAVMTALDVDAAPPSRAEYTLNELVDEFVEPNAALAAVKVHKHREHYTIGDCMAELSEVRTAHGATRTIAVESEDPAGVIAAVRELGLGSRRNVSLPRGLKSLVGLGGRRYAVVDVGTNSVKFHIGEYRADGEWRTIVDRAEVTRLGEGLDETGRLAEKPIKRTVDAIAAMTREAHYEGVEAIAAVGTAGLRLAANSADFIAAVRGRAGVEVEAIPSEEEARLAYLAVKSGLGLGEGSLVVFDTGGGSSQFTFGQGDRVDERFSLDVGAMRFTERFDLGGVVAVDRLAATIEAIAADLDRLEGRPTPDTLVGIGGAVTTITAVKYELATYDPALVEGSVLDRTEIDRQIELYRTRTADQRRHIVGLEPKRAEVILAGACIVHTVLAILGRESLVVSDRGLRHGLLIERFG